MLEAHQVDYLIIVPPRFRTQGLQPLDRELLCTIMGREHVHDFSNDSTGIHDLRGYYDGIHLITPRCTELIDSSFAEPMLRSPF